ncbi:MAG: hypothetical protein H0T46_24665 [Deltaproteobacteria bacterium]|nr:hypothetical protein [Deltaproteobacteria bacterium]
MSNRHPNTAPFTQGVFYVVTGLWPIIHLRSFEAVTGRKKEGWLAKSMGGLIAAVGAALIAGSLEKRESAALRVLGMGSAIALGVADLVFAKQQKTHNRHQKAYYADAAAEGAALAGWIIAKPRAFN